MRLAVLVSIAAAFASCAGPIHIIEFADLRPSGATTVGREHFRPIRPYGSMPVATEQITVTADDPFLHYPNGEKIHVDLGDADSMTLVRTVWKSKDGELSVEYGLPSNKPGDARQNATVQGR